MKHLQISCKPITLKYKVYTFIIKHSAKIIASRKFALSKFVYRFKPTNKMDNVTKKVIGNIPCYTFHETGTFAIVFLHGGAYMNKALKQHYLFANKLGKELNARIYFPLYPLASIANAQICNERMLKFIEALPEQNIILAGDSAGGGLSLTLTHHLLENNIQKVSKIVSICPWLDVTLSNPKIDEIISYDFMLDKNELVEIGKIWMGNLSADNAFHSPIYATLKKDLPILLISGSSDILNPDINLFYEKNKENNITWLEFVGLHHDFVLFNTKESDLAFQKIKEFILN